MSIHENGDLTIRERRQLPPEVHELTYKSVVKYRLIPACAALAIMTIVPWIHIGASIHLAPKPPVDRRNCKNHCFDTIFRGPYEWAPSGYKPVYFNAVPETLKILFHSLIYVILTYEIVRHIVICFMTSSLRYRMLIAMGAFLYPIYYTWWSFFNYINERFHTFWYHDGYFAVTEMLSLLYFVHFCDRKVEINATKLLIPFTLNLTHILVGGLDQFVENIFFGHGERYHRFRNLALLIPDMIIVFMCIFEAARLSRRKRIPISRLFSKEELGMALIFIVVSCVVLSTVLSQ